MSSVQEVQGMSIVEVGSEQWAGQELAKFLSDRALVPDPWPMYAVLRERTPIVECNGVMVVTSYRHVNALFRDPRLSRHQAAVFESRAHGEAGTGDPVMEDAHLAQVSMLINQDEPAHRRIRRILDKAFRPKAVAAWQPRVQAITDELIGNVAGREEFDLLAELAYPLPEAVICDLMGVPRQDNTLWTGWIETVVAAARSSEPTPEVQRAVADAHRGFLLYFRDLVAKRRADLGQDLVSELIRAEAEGDRLSELELLGTLQMLIAAGNETTANLIGNGMLALLRNPGQYQRLRQDPSLAPAAVEEFLRYDTPSDFALPRMAAEDIEIDGTVIPRGALVIFSTGSANHDPAVFDDPEQLDIGRENNRHIGFAAGPHFCLGAMLARREARTMFEAIVTRLPPLQLAEEPGYKTTYVRALKSLHVHTPT
jgi:unspecific monooxygenase